MSSSNGGEEKENKNAEDGRMVDNRQYRCLLRDLEAKSKGGRLGAQHQGTAGWAALKSLLSPYLLLMLTVLLCPAAVAYHCFGGTRFAICPAAAMTTTRVLGLPAAIAARSRLDRRHVADREAAIATMGQSTAGDSWRQENILGGLATCQQQRQRAGDFCLQGRERGCARDTGW